MTLHYWRKPKSLRSSDKEIYKLEQSKCEALKEHLANLLFYKPKEYINSKTGKPRTKKLLEELKEFGVSGWILRKVLCELKIEKQTNSRLELEEKIIKLLEDKTYQLKFDSLEGCIIYNTALIAQKVNTNTQVVKQVIAAQAPRILKKAEVDVLAHAFDEKYISKYPHNIKLLASDLELGPEHVEYILEKPEINLFSGISSILEVAKINQYKLEDVSKVWLAAKNPFYQKCGEPDILRISRDLKLHPDTVHKIYTLLELNKKA